MTGAPVVVWFRRDLRLHDQPALTDALTSGRPVAPLFVFDPRLLHGRFASPNRAWFLVGSVVALRRALEALGGRLFVRVGDPTVIVPAFAREVAARDIVVSRDYTPYGQRRDRAVASALAAGSGALHARRGQLVHEPESLVTEAGSSYRVFSPFLRRWQALEMRGVVPAPGRVETVDGDDGVIPDLAALGLDGPTADAGALPEPGETAGRRRLDAWLATGGASVYDRTRDRLGDTHGTSHLSADLRFGLLSPVEVAARALTSHVAGEGPRRFLSELAWRDFYAHALWHAPRSASQPMDERYARLEWEDDVAGLAAWEQGKTGYPIVDAAMRQLHRTGWIPNRARMIVASFLTKDLQVDWRSGERHFMTHLVDGDPASNLGNWQWVASIGADKRPYVRVFNPVTQARRFDPDGTYVRRWLPQLARVPFDRIQEPWTMSREEQEQAGCRIGVDYPAPIVDHADARRRALARYAAALAMSGSPRYLGDRPAVEARRAPSLSRSRRATSPGTRASR